LRRDFHYHEVLVDRVVDGRNRALAEGVVEHVVDLVRIEAIALGRRTLHRHVGLQTILLQVRVYVGHLGAVFVQLGHEARHPGEEGVGVVARERVLILRGRLPPADLQILLRLHEKARA
jgi:hypothetical protein